MEGKGRQRVIRIRGARQHNLKDIDLDLPKDALIVVTGVSGSGKSTLAFDVLHAEGCRRYLDAFLPASHFTLGSLWRHERPDADSIEGLQPTVAIEHKRLPADPRSTVGTVTEIHDFLRILYARLGTMVCPACHLPIRAHTIPEMTQEVLRLPAGSRFLVLAPLEPAPHAQLAKTLARLRREGFARIRFEDKIYLLDPLPALPRRKTYPIQVVVDRLILKDDASRRLTGSLELAAQLGNGRVVVAVVDGPELSFSQNRVCSRCGWTAPEPTPRLFSHFHPEGACPQCQGLGCLQGTRKARSSRITLVPGEAAPCEACQGTRLNDRARSVRLGGRSLGEVSAMDLGAFRRWLQELAVEPSLEAVVSGPRHQILQRVEALFQLGLDYLPLGRGAWTLSGGEAQRLRLAQQLNSPLSGVLYLLDEPSVGLHARDRRRLLRTLSRLRTAGNTVLLVEHDLQILRWADWVVDLGPGGGTEGGRVLYSGHPDGLGRCTQSLTAQFASGARRLGFSHGPPKGPADGNGNTLQLRGARGRNLRDVTVTFPLHGLTCVTGVSGSGKTTLVRDTLYPAVRNLLHRSTMTALPFDALEGIHNLQGVVLVDPAPIGTTPRSIPATYTGVFDLIRNLFANLPEAKTRGYRPERFSFNTPGGRCETCQGEGRQRIDMVLLPDVYVTCPTCRGSRYDEATLDVRFKGHSIADVLQMTISQALEVFQNLPAIRRRLQVLADVGLDYLRLGQPANTLSGGEAQRIRLARELGRRTRGHTLYILDEPTRGLHLHDVERLVWILRRLVQKGHTVLVVEHHLPFIACADYVIDLGPEGGPGGGRIVAQGTPAELACKGTSHTARALAELKQRR
ncbi:excinuclease ABC subunit A [Desulfacinum hydrothermale DSM 13146]|uniref:UvrABC system protein A n=1 Tax=Desulfacinum hydrothermale DSM 13146 TaxID=1121390 RepID=A0A1W1XKK2_9BACT|nr:ABC-ATPase UvrA [Desulfacinum hydrothermale]SMC24499.1 excinuclease ABC subunit A [Desulfacinum hydrothermale DSM 13146]